MKPPRLVLDTNVLISALILEHGALAWLRHAWQGGRIVPLASKAAVEELVRVLAYPKFRLTETEREELLADYLPYCALVLIPNPTPKIPAGRDPYDAAFLELALAGKANALITGDGDLLSLASQFAIPIIKPADAKRALQNLK